MRFFLIFIIFCSTLSAFSAEELIGSEEIRIERSDDHIETFYSGKTAQKLYQDMDVRWTMPDTYGGIRYQKQLGDLTCTLWEASETGGKNWYSCNVITYFKNAE